MRPPLLKLGGEENFAAYQNAFDTLFPSASVVDVLENEVIFSKDRCHHICFKTDDRRWNRGPREQWSQERAERISWIKSALTTPNYIRVSYSGAWIYMLEVERDRENNLPGELYAAIINAEKVIPGKPGKVYFLTAYTINYQQWNDWKRNKPHIYPPAEPGAAKTSKKKGKK